jgi:hypothetical protein
MDLLHEPLVSPESEYKCLPIVSMDTPTMASASA